MGPSVGLARTVPLIVWPHGGPHSMFACDYKAEAAFFVLLGK
jgi:dipeptidyl aminopeptidase/acylaminoacyl peptidase